MCLYTNQKKFSEQSFLRKKQINSDVIDDVIKVVRG